MYDISMKYFHAKRFVFVSRWKTHTSDVIYIYRFNMELLEIGLHFDMFYIKNPNNWIIRLISFDLWDVYLVWRGIRIAIPVTFGVL